MSKVTTIHNEDVATAGDPDEGLVAALERLLERARSGDISGALVHVAYADGAVGSSMAGAIRRPVSMIGELTISIRQLQDDILDRDED